MKYPRGRCRAEDGTRRARARGRDIPVAEDGKEYFMPNTDGAVIPESNMKAAGKTTSNVFHFHGVTDADSFKKSQCQIAAEMTRMLNAAARRNG